MKTRIIALFALALASCALGHRGRGAVAGLITVRAVDGACDLYLDDFTKNSRTYYLDAGAACAGDPAYLDCVDGKVVPRERAVTSCEVYGRARLAAAHGLQRDIDALANDARAALAAAGVEVR